jgi:tRNA dimethylallyltransferase
MSKKILVILGPTATGKSKLAVEIAKKFNGEIISADSRQVYIGLDIGTGKITKKEMLGVPHHLIDIKKPNQKFSVSEYKELAEEKINDVLRRGKLPIIIGGTGFYIQAIVDGIELPQVPPNIKLRKILEKKSLDKLVFELKKLDINASKKIDLKNKRRVMRAIEIIKSLGKIPKIIKKPKYKSLLIGIDLEDKKLKEKINKRLSERIKKGMVKEAKNLSRSGLSLKKMESFGLEYKYLAQLLKNKIDRKKMEEELKSDIWHYAKRQRTWFKKDKKIKWFKPQETKKIELEIKKFI